MALHGWLPSLAALKTGASSDAPTPEQDAFATATLARVLTEDDAPESAPPKAEEGQPCDVHNKTEGGPDSPFRFTITQAQAAEWFKKGDPISVNNNIYGDTAILLNADVRGTSMNLVIKWFKGLVDPVTRISHSKPCAERAKRALVLEMTAHLNVWGALDGECRQYLSIPACMDTADDGTRTDWYSVQTLLQKPGLQAMGLRGFLKLASGRLRKLSISARRKIAYGFGDMLACIASTGYVHGDMHDDNVMVLTNIEDFNPGTVLKTLQLEWRIIDWGVAFQKLPGESAPMLPKENYALCWDRRTDETDLWNEIPKYKGYTGEIFTRCVGEYKHAFKDKMLVELVDLNREKYALESAFSCLSRELQKRKGDAVFKPEDEENNNEIQEIEDEMRDLQKEIEGAKHYNGPVTEAVVMQWVREAYVRKLGLRIPQQLEKSLEDRLEEDKLRGGGNGKMPVVPERSARAPVHAPALGQ